MFFATLAGLLAVTGEHRYGTIRFTLVFEPRRQVVLAAKLASAGIVGIVFAFLCVAVAFGAGLAIFTARDIDVAAYELGHAGARARAVAAGALSAMIGVAIGTLVRNQVGALVAFFAYALLVDDVALRRAAFGRPPAPGPGRKRARRSARRALCRSRPGRDRLVAWTLAFVAAALARDERTDV